jgi:hypothetical protein
VALGERLEEIGGEQVLGAFLGHVAALLSGVCSCACAGEPLYCSCPGSSYNTCHSSTDGRLKASDVCDRAVLAFVRGSDGDSDALRQKRDAIACLLAASANFEIAMHSRAAIKNLANRVATTLADNGSRADAETVRFYARGLQSSCTHAVRRGFELNMSWVNLKIYYSGLLNELTAGKKSDVLRNLLINLDDITHVACVWAILKHGLRIVDNHETKSCLGLTDLFAQSLMLEMRVKLCGLCGRYRMPLALGKLFCGIVAHLAALLSLRLPPSVRHRRMFLSRYCLIWYGAQTLLSRDWRLH